ncbi:MAG: hypothetical protein AAGI91_09025 [Bacteroidota bacterium]
MTTKISARTGATRTWGNRFAAALVALLALTVVACDSTDSDPNPDPGPGEFAQGVLFAFSAEGPDEETLFIGVYEDVPTSVDLSEMVEVGGEDASVFTIGDDIFVSDGEGIYTKYVVDRTDLSISIEGQLNLTGLGITGELGNPVAFSDTEAYLVAYNAGSAGKVVEFNPQDLTQGATEVIDFEPLSTDGWASDNAFVGAFRYVKGDGTIMAPIVNVDLTDFTHPFESQVFVFDTRTNTVRYETDARATGNSDRFRDIGDGSYLTFPAWYVSVYPYFADLPDSSGDPLTLLRVRPDGTHDPTFSLDLSEAIDGVLFINQVPFVVDGEVVVTHYPADTPIPEEWPELFDFNTVNTVVNLETGATRPFNALQEYSRFNPYGTVNGVRYISGIPLDLENGPRDVLVQNSIESYTVVLSTRDGSPESIEQLWGPGMDS